MPDQVRDSVKTDRVKRLEGLCETLSAEFRASCKGMRERVLWESDNHEGKMSGYTGNYLRMESVWDSDRIGTIEEITISD
jgi:tRNA A37 methylthiotransferase MiaB